MTVQERQAPVKIRVEMTTYPKPIRREWLLPSGFRGETILVVEKKERYLTVEYLKRGNWE